MSETRKAAICGKSPDDGELHEVNVKPDGTLRAEVTGVTATVDITGDHEDLDTGVGTDEHEVFAIGLPANGGHVVGGTPTNPLRVDPVGTTSQPVDDGGGSLTVDNPNLDVPLSTRATETTLSSIDGKFPVARGNVFNVIANNQALADGGTIGPSTPDDCQDYQYWGYSCFSTGAGTLTIEYSVDNVTWRTLATIAISANTPDDRVYRVTRRYYRVTFTDTADGVAPNVDLVTVRSTEG